MRPQATLHLSTGESFRGDLIGAPHAASGELVFTTAMVGYSESLTDPSYFGQILVFAYPLIGNYGVPSPASQLADPLPLGFESGKVHASAVIITSDTLQAFHWSSRQSLDEWLRAEGVPGLVGLDTRHLVQLIRGQERLLGALTPEGKAQLPAPPTAVQASPTTTSSPYPYYDPALHNIIQAVSAGERRLLGKGATRIALVDCGVKWNILRQLLNLGCEIELLPWNTDLAAVDCQGWLLSNGPGNPQETGDLVERVRGLLREERPLLGICLGHQILSLAAGASTERLAYGHRSHNQPVYMVGSDKGYITSQNHGYVVTEGSLPLHDWDVWFRNVNDDSIEGIKHKAKPFKSVQFHPESAGGPRDTGWILKQFVAEVKRHAAVIH